MKVIVTGGAGFIGNHLVHALIDQNHDVHVVDNLSKTGEYAHADSDFLTFHQTDIRNLAKLVEIFEGADIVFHMAALTSVPGSIDDPLTYHDMNVTGTLAVLSAAKACEVKQVVFSSSSAVYGNTIVVPTSEEEITDPISPYALNKMFGEEMCIMFNKVYKLNTISLRYFNVYGPGHNETGAYTPAIATFIKQKREGKTLTVTGDGLQTRDFIHVSDVVNANIKAAMSGLGEGNILNIGSGEETNMNVIAKLISSDIDHIEERDEPKRSCSNNMAAKVLLDWAPKVTLEEGIKDLLDNEE